MKVTPAHDPNDFEIGRRHDLPSVKVIGRRRRDDRRRPAATQGLDRFACRKTVVADLEAAGAAGQDRALPAQRRPLLPLPDRRRALPLPAVVRARSSRWPSRPSPPCATGRPASSPRRGTNTYFDWMENIRDWCISPPDLVGPPDPGLVPARTAARSSWPRGRPRPARTAAATACVQEEDVLDTWFSSALWPFSTMGWPDQTAAAEDLLPDLASW
ncbi:MAG: class I tRNA ligase family protein [Desulfobacterales bacterium]|nr:class I tRNA ligase family protein [Desulfobacterales bacterium]